MLSYSQSLTQWALLLLGGTVAIMVGTEFHRPALRWVRCLWGLFIPGWGCLLMSTLRGTTVQRFYLGYAMGSRSLMDTARDMNDSSYDQGWWFRLALLPFAFWLVGYLAWWIFNEDEPRGTS